MASASTATSSTTASVARHADRRVSSKTSALGSARLLLARPFALLWSSLNSSPFTLLVEAADQHAFHLEVFLDAVLRALAAEARVLHAAKRRDLGRDDAGVRADDADLHLFRDAEDAADVAAVEVAGEAELGVVGELDHLVLAFEANEWRHRAEGLFVGNDHLGRDVRDHGRLEEEAAARMSFPSENHPCTLAERIGDARLALLPALLVDQRSDHHARLGAGAYLEAFHLLGELGGELVVAGGLHVDAVRADAGLARVAVFRGECAFHRRVEVGVVEHDEGRVAAELERELLDGVRALAHEHAASLGRAGERELAHRPVRAPLIADGLRVAGKDVDDAFGDARAFGKLRERERGKRRLSGGLDDKGAAGRERRAGLARDHGVWEVPRRDERAASDRLLHDDDALVRPR